MEEVRHSVELLPLVVVVVVLTKLLEIQEDLVVAVVDEDSEPI